MCFIHTKYKSAALGLLIVGLSLLSACHSGGSRSEAVVSQTFGVVAMSMLGLSESWTARPRRSPRSSSRGVGQLRRRGLFDVAITPDGKTTLVSNFGDAKVYFIDDQPHCPRAPSAASRPAMDASTPPRR